VRVTPVLEVVRYYPALTETFVANEIAALRAAGRRVAVLSLGRREERVALPTPPDTWTAPRWRSLPAWIRGRHHPRVRWLASVQGEKRAAFACWAAERVVAEGIGRVHAHFAGEAAEFAWTIAALARCRWSVTAHAVDLFKPRPSLGALLGAADAVVTVADHHREWIRRHHGVAAQLVRCGVAPAFFEVSRRDPTGPLAVVCVARRVPKKGIEALEHAVAGDPRFQLEVVDGVAPSEIPGILARSQLFALACRVAPDGDRDGVPVALLEAMAAGLPAIATAVAGIPEVLDDTAGWLVPPDDAGALRAALEAALEPAERLRRGAAARARARGWTLAEQARQLAAVFDA
jgi:glycosyltransferase involved in cell wall biosynthesis